MSLAALPPGSGADRTTKLRLVERAAAPAVASAIRPSLVVAEREARELLAAVREQDVRAGGCFRAGPAGVEVWSSPFTGAVESMLVGSVDWTYDTPVRHYVTIYRAMVTAAGVAAGESTSSVLERVLALAGLPLDGERLETPMPPRRDPFRPRPS